MSTLNLILILLFLASFFNGLFLLINKSYGLYKNKFLGVSLMIYSLFLLSYVVWFEEKAILHYPHLLRTVNPLMFLMMPFFYFFVRNTLNGNNHLSKKDMLHFLPAVFHVLELMPLYLMPYDQKVALVTRIVQNPAELDVLATGSIPGVWIDFFRVVLQVIYFSVAVGLLKNERVEKNWGSNGKGVKNWIYVATALFGFLLFGHILFVIKNILFIDGHLNFKIAQFLGYFLVFSPLFLLNLYIRLNPKKIYGFLTKRRKTANEGGLKFNLGRDKITNEGSEELEPDTFEARFDQLVINNKPYLDPEFSLKQLAKSLNVSERQVSLYVKDKQNKGIKEYINHLRIQEFVHLMESGYLNQWSMEGLSFSVGFKSRVTFYNAFKKEKGCSPSTFWNGFENRKAQIS
jgi:AraC-like DNA-binding protein